MQTVVNDLLTTYQLRGKGKLIVLLHGWGDNSQSSVVLQKALAQNYQVLAIDLPGFGTTQAPAAAWGLDDYAGFVEALLTKLHLLSVYAVIGHSNGGAIAIRAVALGLINPQKLVLIAASGIRAGHTLRRLLLATFAKIGKLITIGLPLRYRHALRRRLYKLAGSDMLVVENLQATFKKTVHQDVQADAAVIITATLLLYGSDDTTVPLAIGEKYHKLIRGSELCVVNNAGHFVHLDQPQAVLAGLTEFLK